MKISKADMPTVLWLRDFVADSLTSADDRAFERRAVRAQKMLQRWIKAGS